MWINEKAIARLKAMYNQSKINSENNTNEQALKVRALYPDFLDYKEGDELKEGMRLNYNGVLYVVIQTHEKQELWTPVNAASLFAKVLIEDSQKLPEWEQPDSTNPYSMGDRVTYKGKIWESLVDENVWEPGLIGTEALWKEI